MPGCTLDENDEDASIAAEWHLLFRGPDGLGHAGEQLLPLGLAEDADGMESEHSLMSNV
jgi:hypothetical protein